MDGDKPEYDILEPELAEIERQLYMLSGYQLMDAIQLKTDNTLREWIAWSRASRFRRAVWRFRAGLARVFGRKIL